MKTLGVRVSHHAKLATWLRPTVFSPAAGKVTERGLSGASDGVFTGLSALSFFSSLPLSSSCPPPPPSCFVSCPSGPSISPFSFHSRVKSPVGVGATLAPFVPSVGGGGGGAGGGGGGGTGGRGKFFNRSPPSSSSESGTAGPHTSTSVPNDPSAQRSSFVASSSRPRRVPTSPTARNRKSWSAAPSASSILNSTGFPATVTWRRLDPDMLPEMTGPDAIPPCAICGRRVTKWAAWATREGQAIPAFHAVTHIADTTHTTCPWVRRAAISRDMSIRTRARSDGPVPPSRKVPRAVTQVALLNARPSSRWF
eukprot:Hpha_TRINITY_DN16679_c2_g1::TRINITY_DN16679_c2_g1_i2::g.181073::m.181073